MPYSWDNPLSPTERDDHAGILPFEEFEAIRNEDLSDPTPPNSDSQGTHQILTSKAVSIPIAASGSSEAIDDSDNDDDDDDDDGGDGGVEVPTILGPIRDASVLGARGKIAAVLKVLVTDLEKKEETKAGVKRSFAEFHRDSANSISDLIDTARYECWTYKGLARGFKSE
ncbi:hypothetical protein DL95DRAFT_417193 [Leptodontidium sp. 2 PMI_412]|nr:hypothetical protein DL95DRAFT_417193 [Leptodontidium sp. 2 PMI_412]